jgi:hypothetical protein
MHAFLKAMKKLGADIGEINAMRLSAGNRAF